jgi:hypothetical protein
MIKKLKDRKVTSGPVRGGYQWEGGKYLAKVKESDYGGCTLYTHMKIE